MRPRVEENPVRPRQIVALALGVLLLIPAVAILISGATLGSFYAFERGDDGYVHRAVDPIQTQGVAVTAQDVAFTVDAGTPDRLMDVLDADVQLRVTATDPATPIFVGIGTERQVNTYLENAAYSEVVGLDGAEPVYRGQQGVDTVRAPTDQDFWVASASGPGTHELTWPATPGRWSAVVMNANGSPGVVASVDVGARSGFVGPLSLILLGIGHVLTAVGVVLIVVSAKGRGTDDHAPTPPTGSTGLDRMQPGRHPVTLEAALDPALTRWQWLIKWILAIPHFVVLLFLWTAFFVLTVVAGFAILFTGTYPRSIFDVNVGVLRWSWRVSYYAGSGGVGTDRYPPFTLDARPGDPAELSIAYPARLSRGLVLVKWWLLAIPHYLILALLLGSVRWEWVDDRLVNVAPSGGGVLGLLVLVAAVVLLFTGRYPQALFDLIVGLNRWIYRVIAYAALMTDIYPPFRLDQGGTEPPAGPRPPSAGGPEAVIDEQSLTAATAKEKVPS